MTKTGPFKFSVLNFQFVSHSFSQSPAFFILIVFPEVEAILSKIEMREVKNRLYGYFGSFTWAGAAVKRLTAFGEKMKWETVGTPVEQKQGLKADKYEECWALGEAMANKLKIEN